jgi:hypothetical protein
MKELERDKITFKEAGNQFLVEIPATYFAMHQFNKALVLATGLEDKVKIDKAILKDYNEDLTLVKGINKNPALLAEINKMDLQKQPEEKLTYSDLKRVILQPGRYEQFQKMFHSGQAKEENSPVRPGENGGIGLSTDEAKETLKAEIQPEKQSDLKQKMPPAKPKF